MRKSLKIEIDMETTSNRLRRPTLWTSVDGVLQLPRRSDTTEATQNERLILSFSL